MPIICARWWRHFSDAKVGGVTCLYRGLTDGSLAADLEAIGNSTDFAAGVLVAWLFAEVNFMLGATMAVRKACLAEIGGFESMVDYFSDDYELGNRIAAKGHRVALIPHTGRHRVSASDPARSVPSSAAMEFEHSIFAPGRPFGFDFHARPCRWRFWWRFALRRCGWAVAVLAAYFILRSSCRLGRSAWQE